MPWRVWCHCHLPLRTGMPSVCFWAPWPSLPLLPAADAGWRGCRTPGTAHTAGRRTESGGCAALGPLGALFTPRPSSAQPRGAIPRAQEGAVRSRRLGTGGGGVTEKGCLRGAGLGGQTPAARKAREPGRERVAAAAEPESPVPPALPRAARLRGHAGPARMGGFGPDGGPRREAPPPSCPGGRAGRRCFNRNKVVTKSVGLAGVAAAPGSRRCSVRRLGSRRSRGTRGSRTGPLPRARGPTGPSGVAPADGALGGTRAAGVRGSQSLFKTRAAAAGLFV